MHITLHLNWCFREWRLARGVGSFAEICQFYLERLIDRVNVGIWCCKGGRATLHLKQTDHIALWMGLVICIEGRLLYGYMRWCSNEQAQVFLWGSMMFMRNQELATRYSWARSCCLFNDERQYCCRVSNLGFVGWIVMWWLCMICAMTVAKMAMKGMWWYDLLVLFRPCVLIQICVCINHLDENVHTLFTNVLTGLIPTTVTLIMYSTRHTSLV